MDLDFSKQRDKKLVIKTRNKTWLVNIESITHLTCDGYITRIYFVDQKVITVAKLLKEFETELQDYGFLGANYHTIVNIKHITGMFGVLTKKRLLIYGSEIIISRRRQHLFKEYLNSND
jgi:DNA-binding LytR/AlgR family response regulator